MSAPIPSYALVFQDLVQMFDETLTEMWNKQLDNCTVICAGEAGTVWALDGTTLYHLDTDGSTIATYTVAAWNGMRLHHSGDLIVQVAATNFLARWNVTNGIVKTYSIKPILGLWDLEPDGERVIYLVNVLPDSTDLRLADLDLDADVATWKTTSTFTMVGVGWWSAAVAILGEYQNDGQRHVEFVDNQGNVLQECPNPFQDQDTDYWPTIGTGSEQVFGFFEIEALPESTEGEALFVWGSDGSILLHKLQHVVSEVVDPDHTPCVAVLRAETCQLKPPVTVETQSTTTLTSGDGVPYRYVKQLITGANGVRCIRESATMIGALANADFAYWTFYDYNYFHASNASVDSADSDCEQTFGVLTAFKCVGSSRGSYHFKVTFYLMSPAGVALGSAGPFDLVASQADVDAVNSMSLEDFDIADEGG